MFFYSMTKNIRRGFALWVGFPAMQMGRGLPLFNTDGGASGSQAQTGALKNSLGGCFSGGERSGAPESRLRVSGKLMLLERTIFAEMERKEHRVQIIRSVYCRSGKQSLLLQPDTTVGWVYKMYSCVRS